MQLRAIWATRGRRAQAQHFDIALLDELGAQTLQLSTG